MLPPFLILGLFGFVVWHAWTSRHTVNDKAAVPDGLPVAAPMPAAVADNPPATVMSNQPYGLPPSGPPMSPDDTLDASQMAGDIETDLETNGPNYNRQMMASFQRKVRLTVDGLYGGRTAGALRFYLNGSPYPPIYSPFAEITYVPV